MTSRFAVLSMLSFLVLAACGEPATDAQITAQHSNATLHNDAKTIVAFYQSSGKFFLVNREKREEYVGRWFVRNGQLCITEKSNVPDCDDMFVRDGEVRTALGGYTVRRGDPFGLVARFAPKPRSTRSSGLSAGAFVRGIFSGIASAGADTSSQCLVAIQQCKQSCQGLSRTDYSSAISLSSSFTRCEARCTQTSC